MIEYRYIRYGKTLCRAFDSIEEALEVAFEQFRASYCSFVGIYDNRDTLLVDADQFLIYIHTKR